MEIGSFIELQFPKGLEYYSQDTDIARLNMGRSAIWHALRISGCSTIWIPVYQCDTVREILIRNGISVKFYHIDNDFNPVDLTAADDEAVLLVNYYGIMSHHRMQQLSAKYKHTIIDNCQAFFNAPVAGALNVYSCRKFVGAPDGAYVIGKGAHNLTDDYPQCYSSDTAVFLLQRIEYGCEGKSYEYRSINEHRIDTESVMNMSKLTRTIMDGTDYNFIRQRRRENFHLAHEMLAELNKIDPLVYYDEECIPMVYPLVIENDQLINRLFEAKHFQGHWWSYICNEQTSDTFEYWLSRFVIPVTIDQRYGKDEIEYIANVIKEN